MRSTFSTPEYTFGTQADVPAKEENTEDRSAWELTKDVAIDLAAKPLVGALRTGAQAWRAAEDTPGGMGETVEKGLGSLERGLTEERSPRARALDTLSVDPKGDERSFWREPVAGAIHTMLPSVGYGLAAWATGGSSALAQIGTTAAMGAVGAGDAVNELRDFADTTPLKELQKLPPFQKLLVDFNGNEAAARNQLFKDIVDPKSQIFNFFVQAANFPALKHGLRAPGVGKSVVDRLKATAYGGAEGVALGAGETGTEAYISQLGKVRSGEQENIDTGEIGSAMASGATFGAPMAAFHAIAPPHYDRKATQLGEDTTKTANDQLNQPGGRTGTTQPGDATTPPSDEADVMGRLDADLQRQRAERADRKRRGMEAGEAVQQPVLPGDQAPPHPEVGAPGVAPPDVQEASTVFKTAKGSEYHLFSDGTTIRNKALRDEHPGDEGWKDRSEQTFFVTPEHASQLALVQAPSTFPKRIATLPDGRVGVQYMAGPSRGKFERRTVSRPLAAPEAGATPIETWNKGARFHFGNPITEVAQRPGAAGAAATAQAPGVPAAAPAAAAPAPGEPAAAPAAPAAPPQPPPMQTRNAVWSSESGFTTPVFVLNRPPVLHNGEWHQPVAYVNPHTGQQSMKLAPMRELHEAAGPPAPTKPAREPEAPPVVTPEQPLAPAFPEVEQPGLPSPEDFGDQPEARGARQRTGILLDHERDLIRGGVAGWNAQERAQVGQDLAEIAQQRAPTIYDVPGSMRAELDPSERDTLNRALIEHTQDALDIIRNPPATAMGESGVLQELKQRLALRRGQEAETEASTARHREQRVERERRGMLTEEEHRQIREPEQRREAPEPTVAELALRRAANLAAAAAERRPTTVSEELKQHRRLAQSAKEGARKLSESKAEAQRPSRGERHPLLGGGELTEHEAMTERERTLASDIAEYNKQVVKTTLTPDQRRELDVDRRLLEPRIATFNASAKERGLTPVGELTVPKERLTKAQQQLQDFNDAIARLQQSPEPARAKVLFRQLENINAERKRTKKRALPIPTDLYALAEGQGWTRAAEQREYDRIKQETDALRAVQKAQNDRILAQKRRRGLKGRPTAPLEERLRKKPGRTVDAITDQFGAFTRAIKAHWAALPAEQKTQLKREARAKTAQNIEDLIRRVVDARHEEARQRVAEGKEPTRPGGKLPTAEEAIAEFRRQSVVQTSKDEGASAVRSVRDTQYRQRDEVIGKSLRDSIVKRFGTEKRFQDMLDRLAQRAVKVQVREPWTGGKMRTVNLNLDRRPTASARKDIGEDHNRQLSEQDTQLWMDAKHEQIRQASQLKTFLEHAIRKTQRDIDAFRRVQNIRGRSINWNLPSRMFDQKTARYTFRAGTESLQFGHYNYISDLMKLDEDIRFMQTGLGLREAPRSARGVSAPTADRIRMRAFLAGRAEAGGERPGRTIGGRSTTPAMTAPGTLSSGRIRVTTALEELQRYTRTLTHDLTEFAEDAKLFLSGDMETVGAKRKIRSEDATASYRGVSYEAMGLRGEQAADAAPTDIRGEPGFRTAEVEEGELPGSPYAAPSGEYTPAQLLQQRAGETPRQAEERSRITRGATEAATGLRIVNRNFEEVAPEQADLLRQDPTWITGGGHTAATQGVNVVADRTIDEVERRIQAEQERNAALIRREGRNMSPEEEARLKREQLERDFPIRWTTPDQMRKARRGMAPVETDAEGLPANRMPRHEEFAPFSEAEQTVLDAYSQLNSVLGAPSHPLVSPPETARDTIERLKNMRDKGQALDLPHDYISNDFLDMLADVNEGTTVYHAPDDVVSGIGEDGAAHYNALADRVVLAHDVSPELYARSALHENVHAATEGLLTTDPSFHKDVRALLIRAVRAAEKQGVNLDNLGRDLYGLSNPSEFIAEAVSNQKFREFLFKVPAPNNSVIHGIKNVINALYAAIQRAWRRVTGARNADTALDVLFYDQSTVLGQTDALVKRSMKRQQADGRPAYNQAFRPIESETIGGTRYLNLSAGARAFRDGLNETVARTGFAAHNLRNENQARGLAWYTPADMTQVGSPEFKALTGDFFRAFEEMHGTQTKLRDADKREIAEMAKIWNSWNKEGRERGGKFMIDEGMHTAFADAPLGELDGHGKRIGKNAHIDPDDLNYAQVQQQHAEMQTRLAEMTRDLPRFAEFRDRTYGLTAKREQEVRRNRIRDIMRLSDFVPDALKGKARENVLDAFEHWADTEQKMTPHDQKVLRDAGVRLSDPKILEFIEDVRSEPSLSKIQGPYSPFTRYGDWALTGRFKIERPKNAIVLDEDINEATGQPIDNARYVFETEDEARDMVKDITEKFGLAQMSGGTMWIDTDTGRRPMVPDKRHTGKERPASQREIETMIEKGANNLEERHYVSFQPKLLEMHPSQYVANQNMEAWKERYGDALDISKPMDVFRHDGRQNEQYVSASMQRLINKVRAGTAFQKLDSHEQAAVTREMNLAAEVNALRTGPKQRYLPRNYVKGATTHVLASLDDYSRMSTRFVAKMRHHAELKQGEEAMRNYVKDHQYMQGDRNSLAEQRVAAALIRRLHNPTRDPHENVVSRGLDRFMRYTMLDKLPGMAYFMNNGTEPAVLGAPLMIGRHTAWSTFGEMGGMYRLAGAIRFAAAAKRDVAQAWKRGTAMTDFTKLFGDVVKKEPDAVGLADLYQRAASRNMFDANASLEYQSSFGTSRKAIDVGLDWAQGIFQAINTSIENMNRFVTLGTAYRLEMKRLRKDAAKAGTEFNSAEAHEAAVAYALTISHQANGIYANYNAPEMFTREGPLGMFGPVVFQFKKWPQRVIMIYARAALGTLRAAGELSRGEPVSAENKERARQLVAMLAMTGMVAGAIGLPTEPLSVPVNMAFMLGLSPYNWDDAQAGFRAWSHKTFGQDLGQIVAHGPLSYLTGWDIGSRLGQENMLAFGSPASNKPRDLYASAMGLLGGASLGTASEIWQGFQKTAEALQARAAGADDVAYKKGAEALKLLVPLRQFADLVGTVNGMEGTTLASGRKLGTPYTPWQAVGRAIGYTPTQEAEAREARSAVSSASKRITAQRNQYIQQFVQSPPGLQADNVWRTIQSQWNPNNPGQEITQSDLLKAKRTRTKAQTEPHSQLGLPVDRRTRPLLPLADAYGY